jgi:glycosyltransferase involved in cell wall biosynthesis
MDLTEHKKQVDATAHLYTRIDQTIIPHGEDEIRLFVKARNESLRLPYFLKYYFKMGVDRIFLIDNDSTDATREIALSFKHTHVFKIDESFENYIYWMEYFLETYGKGRWCVVVDIDELIFYPHAETVGLKQLIAYLDLYRYTAIRCLLLDMYSDIPIKDTLYSAGEDPLKTCSYFDSSYDVKQSSFMDKKQWINFDSISYSGGMRKRVFGSIGQQQWDYCLSKIPLLKYSAGIYLTAGMHAVNGSNIADLQGVLFHTKFMSDFPREVKNEAIRGVRWMHDAEYKIYNYHLHRTPAMVLKTDESIRFTNSGQLTDLGLMATSANYEEYIHLI